MTLDAPLEGVDLVSTARWHVQKAIDCSESSVAVTIDRAHAHAQIASSLLQLHEAERLGVPPYIDALSARAQGLDRFAVDTIVKIVRDAEAGTVLKLEQIVTVLRETGHAV